MNKRTYIFNILFFISFVSFVNAQTDYSLNRSRFSLPVDFTSISPAEQIISGFPKDSANSNIVSLSVVPSKFGFKELTPLSLDYERKVSNSLVLGSTFNYFGFDLYNEYSISFQGIFIYSIADFGLKASYRTLSVKSFGTDNALTIDVFGEIKIADYLQLGFILNNINRAYYKNGSYNVYQNSIFGIGYKINSIFGVQLGAITGLNNNSSVFISAKAEINQWAAVNINYFTRPSTIQFGFSLNLLESLNLFSQFTKQTDFGFDDFYSLSYKF